MVKGMFIATSVAFSYMFAQSRRAALANIVQSPNMTGQHTMGELFHVAGAIAPKDIS
jgi:hypothetical protein